MTRLKAHLPLLLVLLLAGASVFYQFNQMPPPYPWADEAGIGYEANLTLAAGPRLLDPAPLGAVHDPHYAITVVTVFLAALIFKVTGPSLAMLRLISGLMGLVSVSAMYFLVIEMFRTEADGRARQIGLAASGLMAVSLWFLGMIRLGWAPPAALMLGTIFFYFFWRALNTQRWRDYVLAGLFLALAQYGHITARFLPFAIIGFLALNFLSNLLARQVSASLVWRQWRGLTLMAGVCLLGCLPIFQYYWRFPEDFWTRARLISPAFAPTLSLSQRFMEVMSGLLGKLHVLGFDLAWFFFQDTTSLLSPVESLLFWGGLALLLWSWRRPQAQFLLLSWAALSAPAWLTANADIPFLAIYDYARRAILAMLPTFIIAAIFLIEAATLGLNRLKRVEIKPKFVTFLSAGVILLSGSYNYYAYFGKWQADPYLKQVFLPRFLPAVERLHAIADLQTLFIFPINAQKDTTERPDLYTIGFLYRGQARFAVVSNREVGLAHALNELTRDRAIVHLLQKASEDDPKQAIPWMLATLGQPQPSAPEVPGYQVSTFHLNPTRAGQDDLKSTAVSIPFGSAMQLAAYSYGANLQTQGLVPQQVESAGLLLVNLTWQMQAEGGPDYNTAVILRDQTGRITAQTDTPLINAAGQTSARWPAGAEEQIFLTLPMPLGLIPGGYWLDVVLYEVTTLRREPPSNAQGDLSYRLGPVTVLPAPDPATLANRLVTLPKNPVELTPAVRIAASSFQTEQPLLTGSPLQGMIYWQALAPLADDLTADYLLLAADGSAVPLAQSVPLGGSNYPTSRWRAAEIVADPLSWPIPPTVPGGKYWLGLRLTGAAGQTLQEVPLVEVRVESWERKFEVPADVTPLAWQVGDSIRLIGARWPQTASPGNTLSFDLFWQTGQLLPTAYKTFVHVVAETGQLIGQGPDSNPGQGQRPTPGWQVGEVVADTHQIIIPVDTVPGSYRLLTGLYDASSGKRLTVQPAAAEGDQDTVLIGRLEVR